MCLIQQRTFKKGALGIAFLYSMKWSANTEGSEKGAEVELIIESCKENRNVKRLIESNAEMLPFTLHWAISPQANVSVNSCSSQVSSHIEAINFSRSAVSDVRLEMHISEIDL